MEKELLLTKSNFRKNKGTSIGIFLLILISTALIGVSFLVFLDAYPTASKEAKKLEAGDGMFIICDNVEGFDDECIKGLLEDDVERYDVSRCMAYSAVSLPYSNGKVSLSIIVNNSDAFHKEMDRTEIVIEDENITENYIYLPYQFYTGGGYNIGDTYNLTLLNTEYSFKIKGFTNTTYFGCHNTGYYEFVLDDTSYEKLREKDGEANYAIATSFFLKDNAKAGKFKIKIANDILKTNTEAVANIMLYDEVIFGKTFMSLIIAISFIVVTTVMILVVIMMIANSISNYIKENMKTIGALKAIGYTSNDIKNSMYLLFGIISIIGSIIGISGSYLLMPIVSKIVIGQMGVPYQVSFNFIATIAPIIIIILFVLAVTMFATRKIGKIQPIVALRDGVEGHNFKKNHVRLDKSVFNLNVSLSFKTLFTNMKQNVITFIVTGLLVFICVIGLLMFENFNRNPKLGILTFETFAGAVGVDYTQKEDVLDYLKSRDDITNIRNQINIYITYKDEDRLIAYVFDDVSKMNNKEVCYKGRMPEYDNEIAVSGKFAKLYGFEIGDEIPFSYGNNEYNYLITGLLQTCNNSGREALMSEKALEHLTELTYVPAFYWYDMVDTTGDNKANAQKVLDDCSDKYGEHIISALNFYEIMDGNLPMFKAVSALMLALMCIIAALVIILILYLLIKSLIYNKRKDYGIYKALGYTSGNLMLQTALSFMPTVILSVMINSVASYFLANSFMSMIMYAFGLMKCTFEIPVLGIVIIGCGMTVLAFVIALWQSRRIKKIEAYNMLIGE